MKEEQWKHVPGYEGRYMVSSMGRVRGKTAIKKPHINNQGYQKVDLWKNWKLKRYLVSRLVAENFIENKNGDLYVDHINRNTQDNRVENLRWVSPTLNNFNTKLNKNNTSGYKGVVKKVEERKDGTERTIWFAQINYKGKYIYLGSYNNPEDASLAYQKELKKYFVNNKSKEERESQKTGKHLDKKSGIQADLDTEKDTLPQRKEKKLIGKDIVKLAKKVAKSFKEEAEYARKRKDTP